MTQLISTPTRGKDKPLSALEIAASNAANAEQRAMQGVRDAKATLKQREKELAIAQRDVRDIDRAITAVRELPTEALLEYEKAIRTEKDA